MPLTYDLLKKQSGFILPSPTMLLAGVLAAACLVAGIQTWRLDASQKEHITFVAGVKAVGEAQELRTKETEARHKQIVKEKNNENLLAHANLAAVSKRLRDKHSRFGLLPENPPGSIRPDLACSDRAELNRALRDFAGEARESAIEGTAATIDLNTAKNWIKALK